MPTYEYICESCDHAFEEFQAITAKPLRKCPQCDKPKLKRLIGMGAGVIFKGGGFYETDYKRNGGKNDGQSKAGSESESKSDSKSESKSDAVGAKTADTASTSPSKEKSAAKSD